MLAASSSSLTSVHCCRALRSSASTARCLAVGVEHAALEQGDPSQRGVERRAQLVRQRREKVVLDAIGLLGLPARLLLALERREPLLFGAAHAQQGVHRGQDHVGRGGSAR